MKIKVCGMREPNNIEAVASLPIAYMGFIFYEKSPRYVGEKIHQPMRKNLKKVGVFVHATIEDIVKRVKLNQLDALQIHWEAPPQYLSDLRIALTQTGFPKMEIWKAFSVDENFDFKTTQGYVNLADKFLFDTKSPQHGGTGVKFDWSLLHQYKGKTRFLLAGGISENDADIIKSLNIKTLWGVDLNSKFEFEPASKDVEKLNKFINKLKSV